MRTVVRARGLGRPAPVLYLSLSPLSPRLSREARPRRRNEPDESVFSLPFGPLRRASGLSRAPGSGHSWSASVDVHPVEMAFRQDSA